MKKTIIKLLAILTLSFGVVFGVKAYNSNSPLLLKLNLEAFNQNGESIVKDFDITCEPDEEEMTCVAVCPNCGVVWVNMNEIGVGTITGTCPICDYDF